MRAASLMIAISASVMVACVNEAPNVGPTSSDAGDAGVADSGDTNNPPADGGVTLDGGMDGSVPTSDGGTDGSVPTSDGGTMPAVKLVGEGPVYRWRPFEVEIELPDGSTCRDAQLVIESGDASQLGDSLVMSSTNARIGGDCEGRAVQALDIEALEPAVTPTARFVAEQGVARSGGDVNTWSSVVSNHAWTPAAGPPSPQFQEGLFGQYPGIAFADGAQLNQSLGDALTSGSSFTIAWFGENDGADADIWFSGCAGVNHQVRIAAERFEFIYDAESRSLPLDNSDTQNAWVMSSTLSPTGEIRIGLSRDGQAFAPRSIPTEPGEHWQLSTIAGRCGVVEQALDGAFAEIMFFDRGLTAQERSDLATYLAEKWR